MPAPFAPMIADALAASDRQVDVQQDRVVVERNDVAERDDLLAAALRGAHLERDLPALEHRPFDLVHPVDLALLVPGLLDVALVDHHRRPELEPGDRLLQTRDLLLLRHVELLLALERDLLRHRERRVVARPQRDLPAVELGDLIDRVVQQVAVVETRPRRRGTPDLLLELLAPAGVQVRLGLVQQQQLRLRDQARGQGDQLPLTARERLVGSVRSSSDAERSQLAADLTGQAGSTRSRPTGRATLVGARGRGPSAPGRRSSRAAPGRSRRRGSVHRARRRRAAPPGRWPRRSARRRRGSARDRRPTNPGGARPHRPIGSSRSARIRSSVDFPAPFGPTMPIRAPSTTSKSTSWKTRPRAERLLDADERGRAWSPPERGVELAKRRRRDPRPATARSSRGWPATRGRASRTTPCRGCDP